MSFVAAGQTSADPLSLGFAALAVSVLAVVVPFVTGLQQRRRDDRAKRAEMFLELMEVVERHGLWVTDRTYDLTETSDDDWIEQMPFRKTGRPPRAARVRARAIVSAYGSTAIVSAYDEWERALDAFELKLDQFNFIAHTEGEHEVQPDEAKPLRDAEQRSRVLLGNIVNAVLVSQRGSYGERARLLIDVLFGNSTRNR